MNPLIPINPPLDSTQERLRLRAVENAAIGYVRPAASIPAAGPDVGERQQNFQSVGIPGTVTIPAGGRYELQTYGDFFYIVSVLQTVSKEDGYGSLTIKDDNQNRYPGLNANVLYRAPKNFRSLMLSNVGAFALTVTIITGFGHLRNDSPLVGAQAYGGQVTETFTRANNVTPYVAGQVVSTTVASNRDFAGMALVTNSWLRVRKALLTKTSTTTANANFTFFAGPTNAQADQAVAALNALMSVFNFTSMVALSTGAAAILDGFDFWTRIGADASFVPSITGTLVANAAYVPTANEQFTITLVGEIIRDVPSTYDITVNVN